MFGSNVFRTTVSGGDNDLNPEMKIKCIFFSTGKIEIKAKKYVMIDHSVIDTPVTVEIKHFGSLYTLN